MKQRSTAMEFTAFPSRKVIRKMGYSDDQDGIMQRYINEEGCWNEHLNNSKEFIKEVVAKESPTSVAILGSGWLLDVPIDFLLEHCKKVYLYDIRHPKPIIHRFKARPEIEFVNMDITGGVMQYVYEMVKKKNFDAISDFSEQIFSPAEEADLTISVNVLNQLDILIVEYLRRFPKVSSETITTLRKKIQLAHIKTLSAGKTALISDYEELLYDRTGNLVGNSSLVYETLPKGKWNKEWVWKFDNKMTYYPNRVTHFKVKAIQF